MTSATRGADVNAARDAKRRRARVRARVCADSDTAAGRARRTTHDAWDPLFIADYYSGNTYSTLNIMLTRADSIV